MKHATWWVTGLTLGAGALALAAAPGLSGASAGDAVPAQLLIQRDPHHLRRQSAGVVAAGARGRIADLVFNGPSDSDSRRRRDAVKSVRPAPAVDVRAPASGRWWLGEGEPAGPTFRTCDATSWRECPIDRSLRGLPGNSVGRAGQRDVLHHHRVGDTGAGSGTPHRGTAGTGALVRLHAVGGGKLARQGGTAG